MSLIYLIGSLRNPEIPTIAKKIRRTGLEVFDDWAAAGDRADDAWRDYEKARGRTYVQALKGYAAKHVFDFDHYHLQRCHAVVLALPAGRSAHIELGWALGKGKAGYVLLDNPERWDVMYSFATSVHLNMQSLLKALRKDWLS